MAIELVTKKPPHAFGNGRAVVCRRGAMMVVILVLMASFIAASALMIGVAQMQLARTELRAAADAAAKSAALQLSVSFDRSDAIEAGRIAARLNLVNSQPLQLAEGDFEFGRAEQNSQGAFVFQPNRTPINTVRVTGRRTSGSASGAIPFFFNGLFTSRNFEPVQQAMATYIERDVVLVVDRSGSMSGQRFLDLQQAILLFTATLAETPVEEQLGLASYSNAGRQDVQLTKQFSSIDSSILNMTVGGSTSIGGGMMSGRAIMLRSRPEEFVERTMIVMTDGHQNAGQEPISVADLLAREGVVIHAITFGNGANQTLMRQVATIGRGRFFHAANGAQLQEVYREIARTLRTILTQ